MYGRRTSQLDVKPFDYFTSAEFTPDYSPEDKAILYGVTGGIPKYLSMFEPEKTLDENIEALFFDDAGYFFEEPNNLIQREFRKVASYNSILTAIAGGAGRISEISGKTQMETSQVTQAVNKLIRVRIVKRDEPVPTQNNKRYAQYVLGDGMFRFWYRFTSPAVSLIERQKEKEYYRKRVKPKIHEYMGKEFETIC